MENLPEKLDQVIKDAMKSSLSGDKTGWPFISIEDYKAKTGKRFRMTRSQIEAGLNREQAFEEVMTEMAKKV